MRKLITAAGCLALTLTIGAGAARAQGGAVAKGPDPSVVRDPEAEKDARHSLEVARHYYKQKKAYRAAAARAEEIVAGYPEFSRLDEALFIAGMSSLRLSEGKGKQKAEAPAEKLRELAREYLSRLVREFPESDFRKEADEQLRLLGGQRSEGEAVLVNGGQRP